MTRRELMKWGVFTASGALALKNGLSPYATSAYAKGGLSNIPTGVPRSPLFGVQPHTVEMPRLVLQEPIPLTPLQVDGETVLDWVGHPEERPSRRLSYHSDFVPPTPGVPGSGAFVNPVTGRGPLEGRPPGEYFAHQRWEEYLPKVGYQISMGQLDDAASLGRSVGLGFHPGFPSQDKNSVWSFKAGTLGGRGTLPPPLFKARYGEPFIVRMYNNFPVEREDNNGFGRNEPSIHFHNAHNGSDSDGASNAFHFPGTFYDYHYTTTMARADKINLGADDPRCSGPDGAGGLIKVPGDFREIQGTMWAHDHRFFFTAENVYKGMLEMITYYSGPDRGNEVLNDGVNLRLPSGSRLDWGNLDFDVNLIVSDFATDPDGQYFFDIFNMDGFLGDNTLVNFAYRPFMKVLPRKYRFRILAASMSRFWRFCIVDPSGKKVAFQQIANDGNLFVHPVTLNMLDEQGIAERYDIVVDFSKFKIGSKLYLLNVLEHETGRKPKGSVSVATAMAEGSADPAVQTVLEFRISDQVYSVDAPGESNHASDIDHSVVPATLTEQIPIVEPVRTRHVEWVRSQGDSGDAVPGGGCVPECLLDGQPRESFPWSVRVNGEEAHSMNANRISNLIPRPGEIEHWTYQNGGGGWDHPIHLHFEEGITMDRGDDTIPDTEFLVRKDVWRLRPGGQVRFQVQFGEYGGAYVNHCHNTVHEDFAMLMRYDILLDQGLHSAIIPTPNPTPDGVFYTTPEVLPEGDPINNPQFFFQARLDDARKGVRRG